MKQPTKEQLAVIDPEKPLMCVEGFSGPVYVGIEDDGDMLFMVKDDDSGWFTPVRLRPSGEWSWVVSPVFNRQAGLSGGVR